MLVRSLLFAGTLLLAGCAGDDGGYVERTYVEDYSGGGYDYGATPYTARYLPGSPVYGAPYVSGPVMGGIYYYGDADDRYGGPVFSPYHGIRCDRRRQTCWDRNGPDWRWSNRFFGHRQSNWGDGDWHHGGGWNHGSDGDNRHGGWQGHGNGNHHQGGGNNPGNNQPWVYQVPRNPDGSGRPAFQPNGCGGNGQPPCN